MCLITLSRKCGKNLEQDITIMFVTRSNKNVRITYHMLTHVSSDKVTSVAGVFGWCKDFWMVQEV
jgi:hypothetical protein